MKKKEDLLGPGQWGIKTMEGGPESHFQEILTKALDAMGSATDLHVSFLFFSNESINSMNPILLSPKDAECFGDNLEIFN